MRDHFKRISIAEKFWKNVCKGDSCWEWTGSLDGRGYGAMRYNRPQKYMAHRLSWELHNGPIENGLWVLHRCDNRRCVRPDHLFLGTAADNAIDMVRKGRGRWANHQEEVA